MPATAAWQMRRWCFRPTFRRSAFTSRFPADASFSPVTAHVPLVLVRSVS
jgi:hypothetical protein